MRKFLPDDCGSYTFAALTLKNRLDMTSVKTVKYHVPHQGIYVYARVNGDKTDLIILNNSGCEQVLHNDHYQVLTKEKRVGRNVLNGATIQLDQPLVLPAGQSLIIEC